MELKDGENSSKGTGWNKNEGGGATPHRPYSLFFIFKCVDKGGYALTATFSKVGLHTLQ